MLLQSFTMIKSSCISSNTIGGTDSPVSISSSRAQVMTGFSPLLTSTSKELSSPSSSATTDSVTSMECLHNCSRLLAMLAQYRLINLMSFFNELIGVLVSAVDFVPLSVALQCEQTLSELSQHNALCAIDLLLPYLPSNKNMPSGGGKESSSPQLVLFALNIITSTLKHVSNTQLQNILPMLLPPSVSLLCGQVVELRQGAVFLMVQLYSIAGESVLRHSALDSLSPSQRSLLTVYINRQQKNI